LINFIQNMLKIKKSRIVFFIILFIFILLSDRYTKFLIKKNFELGESKNIFFEFIRITYIENNGIVFGMFNEYGKFFLYSTPIILIIILVYFIKYEEKNFLTLLAFTLIIAGACGNILDRFIWGAVVDFIDIDIPDINLPFYHLSRWPAFNIADSAISVGIVILLIYSLKRKNK